MTSKEFEDFLTLHGSNLDEWPIVIRQNAESLYKSSTQIQKLVEQEKSFEQALNAISVEAPHKNLAQRIITSAKDIPVEEKSNFLIYFISDLLTQFLSPRYALGLTCILIIGFLLGYNAPLTNENEVNTETETVSFLYDYGEML